ncbi:CDP-diacylglycerol--glycerol-3-phosphate 3-phosphatidyltransferase [Blochmannia endosymbiont of Camponotus (Colobopsis) obliquus]|uniref:CDP-diacylglycerol--glycerol-3-phosphate 3-phosphatidyltransferase n=1 Tax=Blochmannia endosymbiont of Camponotus (Colobopsis) obliquus TaxID=1505597 RepID=UPI00061A551A|nr:CDP-diacylglycerol--glycerol-3-phosphate 3-phosphatidyltransferase [Blochmannia endosymbiont of Camponotus (Colobopsis) obliquus]AKC60571.1 CDP-diacylglycerol--glycerol-3-phosphate 3-phosphatidyltransferase [Blochmannia endosymbiont of Camponotus (Colobopsis) obliquus]
MCLNLPTWLTLVRIIMIPLFILVFYLPVHWGPLVSALIFFIASITDWFDGFLARRWRQTTNFGTFLDPVADKVMIAMALILIAEHFHVWWITLPTASIIAREIIISALREWLSELNVCNIISVSWIAKIKTSIQMLALIALLWRPDDCITNFGIIALYIAMVLTFWSMFQYLHAARYNLFKIN